MATRCASPFGKTVCGNAASMAHSYSMSRVSWLPMNQRRLLDSVRSDELAALLRRCADENACAVVMATHDARTASFADRTLSLTDGELQSAWR
jgi:ABC-type hemin transport system ATPase subunit